MNTNVLSAVFKRNFFSYFASPLGYLFICAFVALSTIAAFWPNEFFNANLANLNQLNAVFPFIMLVFIPAITMSIWADERRQGTDELLLTIPAGDLEIVLGKYLAAVAIYSVSLLFSLVCNYLVLRFLGNPDLGLFVGTYVGYWFVGLAMLAIGMVASFLTYNLTVAYLLGAAFNALLVFTSMADVIFPENAAMGLKQWSIGEQFRDFGRGILSFSGVIYFVGVAAAMLYLSMVLIGRRHWARGRDWQLQSLHFVARVVSLVVVVGGLNYFFHNHNLRADVTSERLSSLAPETVELLGALNTVKPDDLGVQLEKSGDKAVKAASVYGGSAAEKAGVKAGDVLVKVADENVASPDDVRNVLASLNPGDNLNLVVRRDQKESTFEATLPKAKQVQIEAFISKVVPETYVQSRLNLRTLLEEMGARSRGSVDVRIHDTEQFSDAALRAEKRFGITSRSVRTSKQGAYGEDKLYMGVAFTCGLQKVILPFIDRGMPAEYELIRSIMTVTQQKRKRVGILQTDAQLYGRFNFQTMSSSGNWPIIDELQKSYEVVQVDPTQPLSERYDVLLAVQPSSLGPEQMTNFVNAVKAGQPTAIFEDPFPRFALGAVPGTAEPRRPQQGGNPMMGMGGGGGPQPKGEIRELWTALGVDFSGARQGTRGGQGVCDVVFQHYNPYRKIGDFPEEFVFIDKGSGAKEPFNSEEAISSKLQQVLFPFPGFISRLPSSELEFKPLVRTAEKNTGTVATNDIMSNEMPFGPPEINPEPRRSVQNVAYVLAARIHGKVRPNKPMADEGKSEEKMGDERAEPKPAATSEASEINAVVVADIDMLTHPFFQLREQGDIPELGVYFNFDNVTFVLNVLDELASDHRFIEIRKRRPQHRTLARIDRVTEDSREKAADERDKAQKEYEKKKQEIEDDLKKKVADLQKKLEGEGMNTLEALHRVGTVQREGEQRNQVVLEQAKQQLQREENLVQTDLNRQIRSVQERYKLWSVLLPPIPPLFVAFLFIILRRVQEHEGVSKKRLRK